MWCGDFRYAPRDALKLQVSTNTDLTTFAVTLDPQLGEVDTENGRVEFLLLVGVTDAERDQMVATSTAEVLARLGADNCLFVTDLRGR